MMNYVYLILASFVLFGFIAFLSIAENYAKNKPDTKFGKFSKVLDEVLSKIFTDIRDLFSKKNIE